MSLTTEPTKTVTLTLLRSDAQSIREDLIKAARNAEQLTDRSNLVALLAIFNLALESGHFDGTDKESA